MACLLYQPQPVEFAGRRFNKDKLLTQSMEVIEDTLAYFLNQTKGVKM